MSEELVTLCAIDTWTHETDGSVTVRGRLNIAKIATATASKIMAWARGEDNGATHADAQFNIFQPVGTVTVKKGEVRVNVTAERALPLVKIGVFRWIAAIIDEFGVSQVSLVDRMHIEKGAGSQSLTVYKRASTPVNAELQEIADRKAQNAAQNEREQAYQRQYYGIPEPRTVTVKPSKKTQRAFNDLKRSYKGQR